MPICAKDSKLNLEAGESRDENSSSILRPYAQNDNIDEEHREIYALYEKILTDNFNERDQASLRLIAKQESLQDQND
jgi:hypothetical protein